MRRLARLRPQDGDVSRLARAAEVSYGQALVRRRLERALGPEDQRLEPPGPEPVGPPQVCVREREDPARVPLAWLRPPRPSDSGWIVAPRTRTPRPDSSARLRALPADPPLAPFPAAWFALPPRPMPLPALPVSPRLKGLYERFLAPTPTLSWGALGLYLGLFAWIALPALQGLIGG